MEMLGVGWSLPHSWLRRPLPPCLVTQSPLYFKPSLPKPFLLSLALCALLCHHHHLVREARAPESVPGISPSTRITARLAGNVQ